MNNEIDKFGELNGLFVNAERYICNSDDDDDDSLFVDNGTESARFVLAYDSKTSEKVICKVFKPEVLQQDIQSDSDSKLNQCWYRQLMLLREVMILKELYHPTIVDFKGINLYNFDIKFDSYEDLPNYTSPTIYLEYLQNKSIQSHITKDFKLDLPPVKRQICMLGLSMAVSFLHSRKVIHRSLNPKTVWLDENFYPKIFDFSTSREFSLNNDTPKTLIKDESVYYIAPELIEQNSKYDDAIDIFSLGRMIYLLATGCEPFRMENDPNSSITSYLLQVKIIDKAEMPIFPESLSKEFQELLKRCWKPNPSERPTALEICYLLRNIDSYRVDGFTPSDLEEYENYYQSIEKFEREKLRRKLKVVQSLSFEIPLIDDNNDVIIDQKLELYRIIDSNFALCNEEKILDLLNDIFQNNSIFEGDILPKVMNFVNNLNCTENNKAKQFLENIFGEYIIPNPINEINSESINKNLVAINIPSSVKIIKRRAFAELIKLTRINIPNSVHKIEDEAFNGCLNLEIVNIPESIKDFGKGVFVNCPKLEYIQIPPIKIIPEDTFRGGKSLKDVVLSDGIEIIGKNSFNGCESLKYIEIPKTVILVKSKAFNHCKNLEIVNCRGSMKPKTERKSFPFKCKLIP